MQCAIASPSASAARVAALRAAMEEALLLAVGGTHQRVDFRTEEDAWFDGETVRFIDGRQTAITVIGAE